MLELLQKKIEVLNECLVITGQLNEELKNQPEDMSDITGLLDKRQEFMDEAEALDRSIADLAAQYKGNSPDEKLIEAKKLEVISILGQLQQLERGNVAAIMSQRDKLILDLKEVSTGKKRINAYIPPPMVNEGFEFDTMQ